ncbi:hypothetical protein CONLIGDRAFT_671831 [Coniochaeta ligniaria NRRL 30616]|uniref:Secreted protein n=1 Tax=Coniochaeta ligniaria NRRL 30616 TaxID=1408157 RepID=A0A1J7IYN5_9PEZI|nr:hypothetical protein CONLIGDRAFT_671831 [Coniochaeta ligniaria NRRL 30616]
MKLSIPDILAILAICHGASSLPTGADTGLSDNVNLTTLSTNGTASSSNTTSPTNSDFNCPLPAAIRERQLDPGNLFGKRACVNYPCADNDDCFLVGCNFCRMFQDRCGDYWWRCAWN